MKFIKIILFESWKPLEFWISVAFALFSIIALTYFNLSLKWTLAIVLSGFYFIFMMKIISQFYHYYLNFHRPIKVLRICNGEGMYQDNSILILENSGFLRDNIFLTLNCSGSGAEQPICIIQIIKSIQGQPLQAIQYLPKETDSFRSKYYSEEPRKSMLYALPLINHTEFSKFLEIEGEKDG